MEWIGSKYKRLTEALKRKLGYPQCVVCHSPGTRTIYDNTGRDTGYVICDDQRCDMLAFQKYQHDLSEFIVV